jgi:hypothetical protein
MNRWRVGEDIRSKEMDGCPLTLKERTPLKSSQGESKENALRTPG